MRRTRSRPGDRCRFTSLSQRQCFPALFPQGQRTAVFFVCGLERAVPSCQVPWTPSASLPTTTTNNHIIHSPSCLFLRGLSATLASPAAGLTTHHQGFELVTEEKGGDVVAAGRVEHSEPTIRCAAASACELEEVWLSSSLVVFPGLLHKQTPFPRCTH